MSIKIPCEITLELDIDMLRRAIEETLVPRTDRVTPLRRVNETRAADKAARVAAAKASVLADLAVEPATAGALRMALASAHGRNAVIAAMHELQDSGEIVLDRFGVYHLQKDH